MIGVGNRLLGDDGLGSVLVEALSKAVITLNLEQKIRTEVVEHRILDVVPLIKFSDEDFVILVDVADINQDCLIAKLRHLSYEEAQRLTLSMMSHGTSPLQLLLTMLSQEETDKVLLLLVKPERVELRECITGRVLERGIRCLVSVLERLLRLDRRTVKKIEELLWCEMRHYLCSDVS